MAYDRNIGLRDAKGFTLLEMAIVVAIIGLLVGGIMSSQAFLANSELKSMMSEAQNYIDAFNRFTKKYGSVPGDYAPATDDQPWPNIAYNGDNNGVIRAADTVSGGIVNPGEIFEAFQQLALSGLIKGQYTGKSADNTAGIGATLKADLGRNIPESVIPTVGYVFNHTDALDGAVPATPAIPADNAMYFNGKYGHILVVAGDRINTLPNRGFVTPAKAQEIDDKYDDGAPGKGWITTPNLTESQCATDNVTYNVGIVPDATTTKPYNNRGKPCYFFLNITGG